MIDTAEISRMSIEDRLELVELIWDSIADDPSQLPVPESHIAELERRLAKFNANPEEGSSWQDVRRRIENKF